MRILNFMTILCFVCFTSVACAQTSPQSGLQQTIEDNARAFALLEKPGHHVIIRHAYAPEQADPHETKHEGCEEQRNLSPDGERQAVNLGKAFARSGLTPAHIFTSPLCRCYYTGV